MSATPRDLLKTRAQRLAEVYNLNYEKAGQANGQAVTFGGDLLVNGGAAARFDVSAIAYTIGGVEYVAGGIGGTAALTANIVDAGATLSSGQAVKVLLEIDSTRAITQTVGAIVTGALGAAVVPAPNTGRIALGYLGLTGAFTPGTTALTTAMLFKTPYWAWSGNTDAWRGY